MAGDDVRCVVLADRHHGLTERVRGLLEVTFDVVVMVADEVSLFASASKLDVDLAVVDLSLGHGGLDLVRRLRQAFPHLKVIVLSVHDEPAVIRSTLEAGANGFVIKRSIGTDLLKVVDDVMADGPPVPSPS